MLFIPVLGGILFVYRGPKVSVAICQQIWALTPFNTPYFVGDQFVLIPFQLCEKSKLFGKTGYLVYHIPFPIFQYSSCLHSSFNSFLFERSERRPLCDVCEVPVTVEHIIIIDCRKMSFRIFNPLDISNLLKHDDQNPTRSPRNFFRTTLWSSFFN